MARTNWLFPKKRGAHRTGSAIGGRVGEAAFFLCLFLLGVAGIIGIGWSYFTRSWPVDEYFPSVYFASAEAVLTQTRVVPLAEDERFQAEVLIEFEIDGHPTATWMRVGQPAQTREASSALLADYDVGDELTCWYDPLDPATMTVDRPLPWGLWLTVGLLLICALAGGYGVINTALHVGASAERRAALAQVAQDRIPDAEELLPAARDFPTVPRDTNLLNSPGVKLKYRLPSTQEPAWRLFGSAVWMLTCATLAVALVVVAVERHLFGEPSWFLTCFSLLVVALAGWSVYNFLHELVAASWMGPTTVEISEMPLRPAGEYQVYLNQAGNINVRCLQMLLVCDEETTFLQGTDIRHDRQRVFRREICRRERFEIDGAHSVEEYCRLCIPACAMHSFKSRFNAIQWKLVVEIKADDWPLYQRVFPVIVYPLGARAPHPSSPKAGNEA